MRTLERRLGLPSVIGISMGAMLGSGIFVLPGIAVGLTGPSVWMAYIVAGIFVVPAALSKAELATAMPVSGGTYVYVDRAFGPMAGTVTGLALWFSLLLKSAFALVGFAAYLEVMANASVTAVGLTLLAAIVILNILGVRKVGRIQLWVLVLSVSGLFLIVAWGAGSMTAPPLSESFSGGALDFFGTVGFVYISYAGVTKVAAIAEEVKDPGRNLPLGILISLGLATILYGAFTFVMVGTVPVAELSGDLRPVYTVAQRLGGTAFGIGAAVLGILTMTSMANAGLLASSRFPFAMSRDRLLPSGIEYVNERFHTPVVAILLTASLMGAAILLLDVAAIAKLASSLMIAGFMAVNMTVLVLRETGAQWYKPSYRSPLYPVTQVLGLVTGAGLLLLLGWMGLAALLGSLIPGFVLFAFYGRKRTKRTGALGRLRERKDVLSEPPPDLDHALPKNAEVVVPLLGSERAAESLVEVGLALAEGKKVEVAHVTEIPEQLTLDAALEEEPQVDLIRRRVEALGREQPGEVEFDAFVTRDIAREIHDISRRVHCNWLVMEWRPRSSWSMLSATQYGWLVEHLSCNLALVKDAGLHSIRRILVLAEPGPHDSLVATTADHLAGIYGAKLTFLGFVGADAPKMEVHADLDYIDELSHLCDNEPECRIIQCRPGSEVRTISEISAEFDLLVLGAPPDVRFRDFFRGPFHERLTRSAACSVLRLKTPRKSSHDSVSGDEYAFTATVEVGDFVLNSCLGARIRPKNKEALFSHIAKAFADAVPDLKAREIEEALWKRERTQNTAVDHGLAIPHGSLPGAKRSHLGIFTTAEPIDYKAPDGKKVDVIFVTLSPPSERTTHLHILAGLAGMVSRTPLLERLRAAETPEGLIEAIRQSGQP